MRHCRLLIIALTFCAVFTIRLAAQEMGEHQSMRLRINDCYRKV